MKKALGFGLAIVMPFVMGSAFLTSRTPHATTPEPLSGIERPVPATTARPAEVDEDDDADVDLLGNQVSDAVAKYKFDATGTLYELHSPQTELPRLAPPKS